MKNLAGDPNCDMHIKQELERCGVELVQGERSTGEVATTITGKLRGFTFHRAWYYWVVSGRMPIDAARELYNTKVGKADIRAGGHGCGPHPDEQATWFTPDGKEIVAANQQAESDAMAIRIPSFAKQWAKSKETIVFSDNKEDIGSAFITQYHIDSELGLYLLAEKIKSLAPIGM